MRYSPMAKRGLVAKHYCMQQPPEQRIAGKLLHAGLLDFAGLDPQPPHGHPVLGERAGLVGQDHCGRAQRLDRGEPLQKCILAGHAPHPAGKGERGHDRQALGNGGHRERDRRFHDQERIFALRHSNRRDHNGQKADGPNELPGQPCEPALNRRAFGLRFFDEMRNAAEFGLGARRDDHAKAAAARHGRALEQHRCALGDPRIFGGRPGRLVDRHRLARQRRLVGRETRGLHDAQVGGDRVAGFDEEHVARHEVLRREYARVTVAPHARRCPTERTQCLDRSCCPDFGDETNERVERENRDDRNAFLELAEPESERGGCREQVHHRAPQLVKKYGQGADRLPCRDRV